MPGVATTGGGGIAYGKGLRETGPFCFFCFRVLLLVCAVECTVQPRAWTTSVTVSSRVKTVCVVASQVVRIPMIILRPFGLFCGLCDVVVLDMGNVLMTSLKRSRDKGGGHLRKRTRVFSKATPFLFLVNCYLQRKECSSETGSKRFRPDSLVVTMRMNLSPYRVPQAWRLLCGRLHRTKTKKRIGRLCLGGNISRLPSPPNIFCRLQ